MFGEGNTRTTAVFFIKYLRTLGFEATNDIFAENAWYFRNSLVRANYNNLTKGIHETTEYLELFLKNLLCNECNELHNRSMHVSGIYKNELKADIEEEKADIDVVQIYADVLVDYSAKTMKYIRQMYHAFGKENVFGRSDMQSVTGLGHSRASELLKLLSDAKVIEPVTGRGKGKYKFV